MRVSDVERQRTIDELRRHCAAGRIDMDEYGARIEKAMVSSTLQELDELTADLPMIRIADPVGLRRSSVVDLTPAPAADEHNDSVVRRKLVANVVISSTILVALAATGLGLAVSWSWSMVMLTVWLIGLGQGRIIHLAVKRSGR
jgi:hypothetical protein